ncbi:MAG TPA: MFS transporter [Blastocatellia bacterium]|nr:MFS transporter [Blastocatellia bacterium]
MKTSQEKSKKEAVPADAPASADALKDSQAHSPAARSSWTREVTRYQWLVLIVAWLGWVFDSMDGTLFSLVLKSSMPDLVHAGADQATIGFYSSVVFSVMLTGWAIGGITFGILADYIGRTKALVATILIYSLFTGLSAAAQTWWQLAIFRFITGLGLGGEWAAGAALVAEVWPNHFRAKAGAILQSAAAFGYFFAALINLTAGARSWRYVYLVGAAPALFVLLIRMIVKEPEAWVEVRNQRRLARADRRSRTTELGSFTLKQLFSPALRRDTLVASSLAFVVLLALWGGTMWIPAATGEIAAGEGFSTADQSRYGSYAVMLLNGGSLFGYVAFGPLADWIGRRATFLIYFVGGVILFPVTFLIAGGVDRILTLAPMVGFFTLGVTSGFPIYLPELFPTRVRTTGVGFCYNLGRIVTAGGVLITGQLVATFGSYAMAASAVSFIYLLGIVVLILARETRGQRLA